MQISHQGRTLVHIGALLCGVGITVAGGMYNKNKADQAKFKQQAPIRTEIKDAFESSKKEVSNITARFGEVTSQSAKESKFVKDSLTIIRKIPKLAKQAR